MPTATTGPPKNMASEQDDDEDTLAMAVMIRSKNAAREARAVTQAAADDGGNDWGNEENARGQNTTGGNRAEPQDNEVVFGENEEERGLLNLNIKGWQQKISRHSTWTNS